MKMFIQHALGLTLLLFSMGCVTGGQAFNPFQVEEPVFWDQVHKIAIFPIIMAEPTSNLEDGKRQIESGLFRGLTDIGFDVVAASEVEPIYDDMLNKMGGLYDANTGKMNQERADLFNEHIMEELGSRFKCDAVLLPRLWTHQVRFSANNASWYGAYESLNRAQGLGRMFQGSYNGTANALSLHVTIQDMSGNALFKNAGGIQLLAYLGGTELKAVPPEEILAYEQRNTNSVVFALRPLKDKKPPDPIEATIDTL